MSSEKVFAAVISRDIASYLPKKSMKDLVMLYKISRPVPVWSLKMAAPTSFFGDEEDARNTLACYNNFRRDIADNPEQKYFKPVQVSVNFFDTSTANTIG